MSGEGIAAYDRPNFRRMRQEHYELLLKVETESGQKLPQIEDMSAGCLVANITPNIGVRFLLASSLKGNWGIPKGHPNDGETAIEAAMREVLEEVGVPLDLSSLKNSLGEPTFAENCYTFVDYIHKDAWKKHPSYPDATKRPICVVYKTVRYYLAFTDSLDFKLQEEEISNAEWLTPEDAISRFTFKEDGEITLKLMDSLFMREKLEAIKS